MNEYCSIAPDVKLGKGGKLSKFINLNGCEGRHCKISSHTFICEGVTIENDVFY